MILQANYINRDKNISMQINKIDQTGITIIINYTLNGEHKTLAFEDDVKQAYKKYFEIEKEMLKKD